MRERVKREKALIAGLLLTVLAVVGIAILMRMAVDMVTGRIWTIGLLLDLILAPGVYLLSGGVLKIIYGKWQPLNADFYTEWKETSKRQQWILTAVGILLLVIGLIVFRRMQSAYTYFYWNYAAGYFAVFTGILVYALCQLRTAVFMRRKLDQMMDKVSEINRDRLREAVEIEKKSLEKAAKSEQLKIDLISNVSHDLKTPLTSMVGYLELLKKEELDDLPRDYVEIISDKAEKLKEMIESLFSLAKASSGNIQIHPEPVEMNRLIEQILADLEDRIKESGLQFVTNLTEEDTHLTTDNLHMYRICQNLVENALKYSARGTRVFIRTYRADSLSGPRLYLEITNTAGYFMDFTKEDIVERFARGDKARSTEGNGLGLAIVSTYAGALGGSFDIHIDCDQFKAILSFPSADVEETEDLEKDLTQNI